METEILEQPDVQEEKKEKFKSFSDKFKKHFNIFQEKFKKHTTKSMALCQKQ